MSAVLPRVTPRRAMAEPVSPLRLAPEQRARVHMLASLLLDYPAITRRATRAVGAWHS